MKTKLYHVFRTYWNRPLIVVLGIWILFLATVLLTQMRSQSHFSIAPRLSSPGLMPKLIAKECNTAIAEGKLDGIRSLQLTLNPIGDIPDLSQLKELQSLRISMSQSNAKIFEQIAALNKLKTLSLHFFDTEIEIPKDFFKKLGPQLKELELKANYRIAPNRQFLLSKFNSLKHLQKLKLLKVTNIEIDKEAIEAIAQIPNLKTLVLDSRLIQDDLNIEWFSSLKNHSTLNQVYANWTHQPDFGGYDEKALSPILMLPLFYGYDKQLALVICFYLIGPLTLLLSLQLWSHFISTGAMLIPGYSKAHLRAALIILCGGVGITVINLMIMGIACLPAIVFTLMVPTVIGCAFNYMKNYLLKNQLIPVLILALWGIVWISSVLMSYLELPWITGNLVWFFQGHYWGFTLLLLIAELAILAVTYHRIPTITRVVTEQAITQPAISPWEAKQLDSQHNHFSKRQSRVLDNRLDNLLYHQGSMWKQIKLWNRGTPSRSGNSVFMLGMFLLALLASETFLYLFRSGNYDTYMYQTRNYSILFAILSSSAIALSSGSFWSKRCKKLELETMRPVSRKDLVRQLFLSMASNHFPSFVLTIPFLLAIVFLPNLGHEIETNEPYILSFIAGVLWVYAISTTVLAFKRTWIILIVIIANSVSLIYLILFMNCYGFTMEDPIELSQKLITDCSIIIPASLLIITFTYCKALNREWG